ncbi:MAG: type II toxin-antitoxin system VapC family toxin [Acidobacteriota bacterium]
MYLLDTDTMIYSLKGHAKVNAQLAAKATLPKAISVVTYGELYYGAMESARAEANLATVRRTAEIFPVIDVSRAVMETFDSIKATLEKRGSPLADFDLIVASTALVLNYVLVTNNRRRFKRVPGLRMENWSV